MGVLGRYGTSALKYYQSILQSAYQRKNVTDMWTAIHNVQDQYGLPTTQTSVPDVQVIRGYANRIVAGAQAFAAANPSDTITSDMMATAPYTSRDQNAISTTPQYQVRGITTYQKSDGTTDERWFTSIFNATNMPGTVGKLQDTMLFNANESAAKAAQDTGGESGGRVTAVDKIEIVLVLSHAGRSALPQLQ